MCLSPFSLKNLQMKSFAKNFYRNLSIAVIAFQALVIILSLVFVKEIIEPKLPPTIKTLDTLEITLIQVTVFVILLESLNKRFVQIDFLRKINSIDFILEYKIGITLNYRDRRRTNIIRLLRWIIMDISIFIINLVTLCIIFRVAHRWWIILYVSFIICSLRYYQIITYVDIIHYRYTQINQFINNLHKKQEETDENVNYDLLKTMKNVRKMSDQHKSAHIHEKLSDLRRVCRLLSSANRCINEMFQFSIPLIIVNDFLQILVNCFWVLRIFLADDSSLNYLIAPLFWAFLNFNHVLTISAVCDHASKEVIFNLFLFFT